MDRMISVTGKISRSAFSDERVFRLTLADGKEHIGAASLIYLYKSDGRPLSAAEPSPDRSNNGRVAGRGIKETAGGVVVSLPDGEVVEVKRSQVSQEAPRNVLVES